MESNILLSILPICSIATLTFYVSIDQTQLSLTVVQDGGVHVQDGRLTSEVADYIIQVYLKPTLDFDPSLKIKRSHKYWSESQQTNVFSGHPHPTYRNSITRSLRTTALNSLKGQLSTHSLWGTKGGDREQSEIWKSTRSPFTRSPVHTVNWACSVGEK